MKFNIFKTRNGKLRNKLVNNFLNKKITEKDVETIMSMVDEYEKANLSTIDKLKKDKSTESKRISGALKQTIDAHSVITKELIGSATKRIMGALLINKKTKKEIICEKISSIYHTFLYIVIFIIKLDFMKNKDKISVTISKTNNERLNDKSINKSKLIDKLLSDYFKKTDNGLCN